MTGTSPLRWAVFSPPQAAADLIPPILVLRLGDGLVDLDACMAHLRKVKFDGYYALETCCWNNLNVSLAENLASDCAYMLEKYPEN